jgi:ligand-binding sensor domain-containing protein
MFTSTFLPRYHLDKFVVYWIRLAILTLAWSRLQADWTKNSARFVFNYKGIDITPLSIAQDSDGWLWIAAEQGVFRFDGKKLALFVPPKNADFAEAKTIAIGQNNAIWIGTKNALFRLEKGETKIEIPRSVNSVIVTRRGSVFALCETKNPDDLDHEGLFFKSQTGRQWTTLPFPAMSTVRQDSNGGILFPSGYSAGYLDEDGLLSALQKGKGLKDSFRIIGQLGESRNRRGLWRDLIRDDKGILWARSGSEVSASFENSFRRFDSLINPQGGSRNTFFVDSKGRIWVMGKRLQMALPSGLKDSSDLTELLPDVTAMFEDKKGTLWVGREKQGLTAILDDKDLKVWRESDGLYGGVNAIAKDSKQNYYAATASGIQRLEANTDTWKSWGGLQGLISSVAITAADKVLAVPKHPERLGPFSFFEFDSPAKNQKRQNVLWNMGIRYFMPRLAHSDRRGVDWLAAVEDTFRRSAGGAWQQVDLAEGGYVSDVQIEADGNAYIGHENGVSFCRGVKCEPLIRNADGLLNKRVRSIAANNKEIWVTYRLDAGFSCFRKTKGRWIPTHFLPEDGYSPNNSNFIRRDSRGWIWRGTTDGVFVCDGKRTSPQDWVRLSFGSRPDDNTMNLYSFFEESPSSILIGTRSGLVSLKPRADWFQPRPTRIASLRIDGEEQNIYAKLRLKNRSTMEIELANPGDLPSISHQLRYRLHPLQEKWANGSDDVIAYPRLQIPFRGGLQFEALGLERSLSLSMDGEYDLLVGLSAIVSPLAGISLYWWRRDRRRAQILDQERKSYFEEKARFFKEEKQIEVTEQELKWLGSTVLERFSIENLVARGGFATVFSGVDSASGSSVAIKILHPIIHEVDWRRRRFLDEVSALGRLSHVGIVRLIAYGEANSEQPCLVMNFVEGPTLRQILKHERIQESRAIALLLEIAPALETAHAAGVLHRDLKPENVIVQQAEGREIPVLIDFGIAIMDDLLESNESTHLAGSLGYVAPERWFSAASRASEVYSIAAIAFEMFTAKRWSEAVEESRQLANPKSIIEPMLKDPLCTILAEALAVDVSKRTPTIEEFSRQIRSL